MGIELAAAVEVPRDGGTDDHVGSELDNIAEIGSGARQHDTETLKRLAGLWRRIAFPHQVSVGVHTRLACNVDQFFVADAHA